MQLCSKDLFFVKTQIDKKENEKGEDSWRKKKMIHSKSEGQKINESNQEEIENNLDK